MCQALASDEEDDEDERVGHRGGGRGGGGGGGGRGGGGGGGRGPLPQAVTDPNELTSALMKALRVGEEEEGEIFALQKRQKQKQPSYIYHNFFLYTCNCKITNCCNFTDLIICITTPHQYFSFRVSIIRGSTVILCRLPPVQWPPGQRPHSG